MKQFLKVDFHCHSNYSPDSLNKLPDLLSRARRRGLDRLVVTDHNRLDGALAAKAMDPELVIVGEEIVTDKGEILAAFVKEEIPRDLPVITVIEMLRAQGAYISVSHPFDPKRGWKEKDLAEIIDLVDALEVYNARCLKEEYNARALYYASEHGKGGTVGSDVHIPYEVGRVGLVIPWFEDVEGLKKAMNFNRPDTRLSPAWVHIISGTTYQMHKLFNPALKTDLKKEG